MNLKQLGLNMVYNSMEDVNAIFDFVRSKFKDLELKNKVILLRDLLKYPIDYKNGIYFKLDSVCNELEMSDEISIMLNWINLSEAEKLNSYFIKLSEK